MPCCNRLEHRLTIAVLIAAAFAILFVSAGCGSGSGSTPPPPVSLVQVNSTADTAQPSTGVVTLRSAIENATASSAVTFDSSLDGATIQLSIIGESHSALPGEIYAGGPPTFQGYSDRDYGKSAIYVKKDLTIDASALPHGITIQWTGGDANPARVLAVYGNLTLRNVRITGGYSKAEAINDTAQPYTLARGGGLAVWGTATLENCAVYGNRISGDLNATRDRGAYGGGIYANGLDMTNRIVSGNSGDGYGVAGGGVYSVGGAASTTGHGNDTRITRSSITGNRVTAQHSYGGGVFTLSGGPRNLATMTITNSTIARNLVEDNPALPEAGQYYYRGGGIYMGGGSLVLTSSTVVENQVRGNPATFSSKPNMGGGGLTATIGDAHTVEDLTIQNSIIAGNTLNGAPEDVFAGSLLNFFSYGYNLFGALDFHQILVPVPDWMDASRKHYPKTGDSEGVDLAQVVAFDSIQYDSTILSAGTDAGQHAVLWYPPSGNAVDRVPTSDYSITYVRAGYTGFGVAQDDFLNHAVQQAASVYGVQIGADFASQFGDMTGITWYGPAVTWPSNTQNAQWITAWRNIDTAIGNRIGPVLLGDDYWDTFHTGPLCAAVSITVTRNAVAVKPLAIDQRNQARPKGTLGDIGAIER